MTKKELDALIEELEREAIIVAGPKLASLLQRAAVTLRCYRKIKNK